MRSSRDRYREVNLIRRGLTLVELLVVIVVISLLIALLIPGVLSIQEAARRSQCSNNLKQIGLAIASYATQSGCLPQSINQYSPLARLLPYMEQQNLYNQFNLDTRPDITNYTVYSRRIGLFNCPSDAVPDTYGGGCTNYALNGGTMDLVNAPFSQPTDSGPIGYAAITDGLSQTAVASEWLVNPIFTNRDPQRSTFLTYPVLLATSEFPTFLQRCQSIDTMTAPLGSPNKGCDWIDSGFGYTSYNHALPPGSYTCGNGTLLQYGAWGATSGHGRGANTLFGDGHVQYFKPTISPTTWAAIGTMNGGESYTVE